MSSGYCYQRDPGCSSFLFGRRTPHPCQIESSRSYSRRRALLAAEARRSPRSSCGSVGPSVHAASTRLPPCCLGCRLSLRGRAYYRLTVLFELLHDQLRLQAASASMIAGSGNATSAASDSPPTVLRRGVLPGRPSPSSSSCGGCLKPRSPALADAHSSTNE